MADVSSNALKFTKISDEDFTRDPLYYGSYALENGQIPKLTSGHNVITELEQRLEDNKLLDEVLHAPDNIMDLFREIFPEVVDSNEIGTLSKETFKFWNPRQNEITIELDPSPDTDFGEGKDVYIGGPAALFSAAIQSKDKSSSTNVLYGHNGARGVSNWKGAASYHHIRDIIPVYYWPDNSGLYTIYATAKHFIQRNFSYSDYKQEIKTFSNFNKLRLNVTALLKEPSIIPLLIKNGMNALKDVGLHMTKDSLVAPQKTTAYTTLHHASLTEQIIDKMDAPRPILMKSSDLGKNLLLLFDDGEAEDAKEVIRKLQKVANGAIDNHKLTKEELADRGYNNNIIDEGLEFPNDGYIPPYTDGVLENMITNGGGEISSSMKLQKILVSPTDNGDCKATRIVWKHELDNKQYTTPVNSLFLSLGPSMRKLRVVPPKYSLPAHLIDVVRTQLGDSSSANNTMVYPPTFASLLRHATNNMQSSNLMQKVMLASGVSASILVKVDKSIVPESHMRKFRDHIDSHNKHIVRLAEKEVLIEGKPYQFFALQTTGGGHFPMKDVHAEAALNVLQANAIPALGLKNEGIEYDIISARSCARGITGQNVFRIATPLSNMAMIYGIGGIGVSTMAPNALLLKAIQGAREKLSNGEIDTTEYQRQLKESDFGTIRHWSAPNPFARNYAQFVDNVDNPMIVAKKLGVSKFAYLRYARNILTRIRI